MHYPVCFAYVDEILKILIRVRNNGGGADVDCQREKNRARHMAYRTPLENRTGAA